MVIIPSAHCYEKCKGFQDVKLLCIHLHNEIQVHNQTVLELWFHEGKVGEGMFIFHVAQDHNCADFGHFKPLK
jgi:hypothetical protein